MAQAPIRHNTPVDPQMLSKSIATVPAGRWGIGVSGGADSVALLLLMLSRADVQPHIVHLDHETRGGESGIDAAFVARLGSQLNLTCTIEKRSTIESSLGKLATNAANRYRQARYALFAKVAHEEGLQGILLAHHADDQAETVLMRLLRGASAEHLHGMRSQSTARGVQILRPLLQIPGCDLRSYLQSRAQPWREDASNQSFKYQRNRLRHWLADQPGLRDRLIELQSASVETRSWLDAAAPSLGESFSMKQLSRIPLPLARRSAARWLMDRGVPADLVRTQACNRLIEMACDAASPSRQHFPGKLLVYRRGGIVGVER